MSQVQSEVRPNVARMPISGFALQTGGSARRRIIKPLNKQAPTDSFPIQNEYRVSGVPGHTHNSSAVASVMVDLSRTRGNAITFTGWSAKHLPDITMLGTDPGDSEQVADEDIRFDRALERGIGEICLRPENCHHEIREPVRSIAEIRTLVAPDDRLQTLTYVEEVGGFINKDKTSYISEFPDVYIDLLGYRTIAPERDAGGAGGGYTNTPGRTPLRLGLTDVRDIGTETEIVILRPVDNSVGFFNDGSAGAAADASKNWYGIVQFQWQPDERLYRSEPFDVTFRTVHEVQNNRAAGAVDEVAKTLDVHFPAIKTTQAENGYCFLMNPSINNTQAMKSAEKVKGPQFRPKIPIDVFSSTAAVGGSFQFEGDCAYRIKTGGTHVFPGFVADDDEKNPVDSYFEQIYNMRPSRLAKHYEDTNVENIAADGAGFWGANTTIFDDAATLYGSYFDMFNTVGMKRYPQVFPRNSQVGASFEGVLSAIAPVRCNQQIHASMLLSAAGGGGYGTSRNLIARALLAMSAGAPDAEWPKTSFGNPAFSAPLRIDFEETDVKKRFDEHLVRPSKFKDIVAQIDSTDVDSYWYWRENILPTITSKALNVAQAANLRIPDSRTWFKDRPFLKKMFISGLGLAEYTPVGTADASFFKNRMITVPAQLEFYYNGEDFNAFTYQSVNDADGIHDFELSRVVPPNFKLSKRFYILGDAEADLAGLRFGLTVDTASIFAVDKISNHTPSKPIHIVDVRFPDDKRNDAQQNIGLFKEGFGVGNIIDLGSHCIKAAAAAAFDECQLADIRLPVIFSARNSTKYLGAVELWVQNLHFSFDGNRTMFLGTNFYGTQNGLTNGADTCYYFHTKDCRVQVCTTTGFTATDPTHTCLVTVIERVFRSDGTVCAAANMQMGDKGQGQLNVFGNAAGHQDHVGLCYFGRDAQETWFGNPSGTNEAVTIFDAKLLESSELGPVLQSKKRISQHLCAPVLNPNMRIGCTAPLNFETGHLPPELRDFRLELRDVDFSFLPGKVNLEPLVMYEFNGGNQVPSAHDNLLHLPQFRKDVTYVDANGNFELEVFSPYGMPSYIAVFCRDQDRSRDHMTQPLIKQLNIMCTTTQKKSNTILDANVHQLYHITQRNVNQRARYNRTTFNNRQVILIRAEDVGMMGLGSYQVEKRAKFKFSGTVDQLGMVTTVLIFNNRGLYIQGKHMSVVRLKE